MCGWGYCTFLHVPVFMRHGVYRCVFVSLTASLYGILVIKKKTKYLLFFHLLISLVSSDNVSQVNHYMAQGVLISNVIADIYTSNRESVL